MFERECVGVLSVSRLGYVPLPLCWPGEDGQCGCGGNHSPKQAGKAPLTWWRARTQVSEGQVNAWWREYPKANVGLLIHLSGLVVLDIDGEAGRTEAEALGIPETLSVKTHKGSHYYFRRPEGFPEVRKTQRGESKQLDLLSVGYVVMPPSLHRSGTSYSWGSPLVPASELPTPPDWMLRMMDPPSNGSEEIPPERPPGMPSWSITTAEMLSEDRVVREGYASANDTRLEYVKAALSYLCADGYDQWMTVGMALKSWDQRGDGEGRGFTAWSEWSRQSTKYESHRSLKVKWRSFQRTGVTVGTVYALASSQGYDLKERGSGRNPCGIGAWFK